VTVQDSDADRHAILRFNLDSDRINVGRLANVLNPGWIGRPGTVMPGMPSEPGVIVLEPMNSLVSSVHSHVQQDTILHVLGEQTEPARRGDRQLESTSARLG
jgi:hypothetical protein